MTASNDDILQTATTKREFLSLVGGAAALAGSAKAAETTYDIVVVGGGTAGLPLAIFAAARGANVAIVETAGSVGGTLFLSGGMISAAGTKLQKSKGIVDTPQSHYDDIMNRYGVAGLCRILEAEYGPYGTKLPNLVIKAGKK